VVSKILYLRQHYHFGPARIAAYLERFHRIEIASSSVHRILQRAWDESAAGESEASAARQAPAAV
jgi:hypothetical protein